MLYNENLNYIYIFVIFHMLSSDLLWETQYSHYKIKTKVNKILPDSPKLPCASATIS